MKKAGNELTGFAKVVAIDGPSGSGKSTVARNVAQKMNFLYVDTGAMFRAMALALKKSGVDLADVQAVVKTLPTIKLEYGISEECLVRVNGENLTAAIRQHDISELASQVSKIPEIRDYLQDLQRSLVKEKICVMEGRDIGTVIFPQSFCKIFLTAELDVRAARRHRELQNKGSEIQIEQIVEDMRLRDERDSQRDLAPLKAASDAYTLDSSKLTLDEVVNVVITIINKKLPSISPAMTTAEGV